MQDILTAQDVAELLQMHIMTVYKLAESGELPGFKVGRQWRFRGETLDEWCRAKEGAGRPWVLVVDDDHGILDIFASNLRSGGIEVAVAENGEQALQACRAHDFSMVFLDLKMPEMDGVEVMKRIKERQPEARIVIMTGFPTDPLVGEAAKLDPVMILHKPFDIEHVMRTVQPLAT
ncbi:MAG: response regulator [Armatimonadota bacterium]